MIEKTFKIFSLCDSFNVDGFRDAYESLSDETSPDSYISYKVISIDRDLISRKLVELGAEDGEEVLIHIDY